MKNMGVTLLAVGSVKKSWIQEGCQDYSNRLGHEYSLEVIEVPASKQKDPVKQLQEESKKILDRLQKMRGQIWVLDERGQEMTSEESAEALSGLKDHGESVIFVIGGAYGLSDEVRSAADRIIKLSDMTLPHELCRIVFLEQLYRAGQIQKGTGYHH